MTHVWMNGTVHYPTEPLDEESLADLIEGSCTDLLLLIDGKPFNTEDLCQCSGCSLFFTWRGDLDGKMECEDCAEESLKAYKEQKELERWALWACR